MALFFARRSVVLTMDCLSLFANASRRIKPVSRTMSSLSSEPPVGLRRTRFGILNWDLLVNQVAPVPSLKSVESQSPEAAWIRQSQNFLQRSIEPDNAYSGRSVKVEKGDIASASRKLSQILADNNIWRELRMAARHERKGEKRRRLRSERWRRMFKNEVRKRVELVQQIRRHGS